MHMGSQQGPSLGMIHKSSEQGQPVDERDFFLELRVACGLKNKVLVLLNPFRNIFVFGSGYSLSLGPRRLANLYENAKGFEKNLLKIVIVFNCLRFLL
jgi:hypothetical protein